MRNFLLLLFVCYACNISYARNSLRVDSIRIIGHRTPTEYVYNFGKENFYSQIIKWTKDSIDKYDVIDTMINHRPFVDSLVSFFDKAKKVKKVSYNADEILLKAKYLREFGYIGWIEQSLDYRLLFILFKGKKQEFVWLSTSFMERGRYRYNMSEDMLNYIDQFSKTIVH